VRVVSHPEFLREGAAVQDFFEPSLLVIGGHDPSSMQALAEIYTPLGLDACLVSLRTAELIKYACNAFHALKIAFANEIGTIAARVDVDPAEVLQTLCNDRKLNISNAYLRPGFAFGGSCLPKDLRALMHRSSRMDIALPLLESVLPSNEQHLRRWIDAALAIPQERIGVFGLAFKENTDDLRESPVVTLIEQLLAKGRDVKVFDPHIKLDAIYGSNLSFLMKSLPHIGKLVVRDLDQLLSWSEHLIIAQPPSSSAQSLILSSSIPAIDMTKLSHKPEYGTSELAGAAIHMS
jgi:GDP-mannose 6-dehydrogenase